jgi:hypothetical protein
MCDIAGMLLRHGRADEGALRCMAAALAHRGPDDLASIWQARSASRGPEQGVRVVSHHIDEAALMKLFRVIAINLVELLALALVAELVFGQWIDGSSLGRQHSMGTDMTAGSREPISRVG